MLVEIIAFGNGVGHFECEFQGIWGLPTNNFWRQRTRVPGLSRGVVCVILRLADLVQCRLVTDRWTHDNHASIASRR